MRTYSLLKNMSVYDCDGSCVGEVCDICITDEGKVKSLIVKGKGFFHNLYSVPMDQVQAYGPHVIVLQKDGQLRKYKEAHNEYSMCHFQPIALKFMISGNGEELGLLEDVYFQEEVGTIIGYELTDGFFSDMLEGKRFIHSAHPPKFGKDAIIVTEKPLRGGDITYDEVPQLPK
ncbi:hypothetical protein AN964_08060 [Heyndrickxia shackletonii]|uniref:PRC-barrel domain-containing protein n=1 Tax=Heyndrickxia shackletonii TaxID=157838 RepID=A0A0Q3WXE4_9BACI|nr:PRC-barrel domain-containing protein [Heyndrickxia shackletonii]KQL53453.1 hypothetical protein AN964_08060 [Heyndrickxia shackletonii]MBB2481734.1 PRC-barrel domain-containing protein [Bacillus sp. APMAM]NEZ00026.1 photosystem reaction center subunit H [Heyndrickxia shackletonii]RTZ54924.1 photosystem reaction center subunit H [Bacillus sp. SAJ1]